MRKSDLDWARVYGGRVIHAFTGERREIENSPRNIPKTIRQRKTLCGKWFGYACDPWDYADINQFRYSKCKACEAKSEKMEAKELAGD